MFNNGDITLRSTNFCDFTLRVRVFSTDNTPKRTRKSLQLSRHSVAFKYLRLYVAKKKEKIHDLCDDALRMRKRLNVVG